MDTSLIPKEIGVPKGTVGAQQRLILPLNLKSDNKLAVFPILCTGIRHFLQPGGSRRQ
jgi:hypothetical protein